MGTSQELPLAGVGSEGPNLLGVPDDEGLDTGRVVAERAADDGVARRSYDDRAGLASSDRPHWPVRLWNL